MLIKIKYCFSDVDECLLLNVTCGYGAECVNTDGSYKCECSSGFKQELDGNCSGEILLSQSLKIIMCFKYCFNQFTNYLFYLFVCLNMYSDAVSFAKLPDRLIYNQ